MSTETREEQWERLTSSLSAFAPQAFALVTVLPDGTTMWGADYGHFATARAEIVKWMGHMYREAKKMGDQGVTQGGVNATIHSEQEGSHDEGLTEHEPPLR